MARRLIFKIPKPTGPLSLDPSCYCICVRSFDVLSNGSLGSGDVVDEGGYGAVSLFTGIRIATISGGDCLIDGEVGDVEGV